MTRTVSPDHLRQLAEGSGILQDVIDARGWWTTTRPEDLTALDFADFQATTAEAAPVLVIPLWNVHGQQEGYEIRPDVPRITRDKKTKKKKEAKYETPHKGHVSLDVHPSVQPLLTDRAVPLWITEGVKKGDALASHGACAIALMGGVWGFKVLEWEHVTLTGRHVRTVYDSDVMEKEDVTKALQALVAHLATLESTVQVQVAYPPSPDGAKVGVDDYLLTHTMQDLEDLLEAPRPAGRTQTPAQVELLDEAPLTMRRPLAIIAGHTYAAIWPWVQVTVTEVTTKKGDVVTLKVPEVHTEQRLAIVRDDGVLFGEQVGRPLAELGLTITLSEIPASTKLWQTRSVKAYLAGERPEPKAVFVHVKTVVHRFLDFHRSLTTQDSMCELVTCYILATWMLDAFPVVGYLWPNGTRGSGKTKLLMVIAELAYLGQMLQAGGSLATLRDLADYGATLCFDDAEAVMDVKKGDPDKRTLLLAGNHKGSWMTVKEPAPLGAWKTRYVHTFCPRLFSAIRLPDPVLASRTIIVPLLRTADTDKANADPMLARDWPLERAPLLNDLWALALSRLSEMEAHDAYVADHAPLMGRMLEPWRAILAVAHWLTDHGVADLYGRMVTLAQAYQTERRALEPTDFTAWTIQAFGACCIKCPSSYDADEAALDADEELFASASSASSASSAEREPAWIVTTEAITQEVKELLEDAKDYIKPESVNSKRV